MSCYRKIFFSSVSLFLLSLCFYRYRSRKPVLPKETTRVLMEGEVSAPPYFKGRSQYLEIQRIRVLEASDGVRLDTVRVRFRATPRFSYGDILRIEGAVTPYATMGFPEVEKVGQGGNIFRKILFRFRERLEGIVCQALPEPEAGLLSGILLGSKHALSYEWEEVYKKTGLMHVVVASGYNITVLVRILGSLFRPLGMVASFVAAVLGIVVFTLMLGAEPPVLRAAIMGVIALGGKGIGRERDVLRALLFSVVLMILFDPLIVNSLSFKLSLAASLGLILLATPLQKLFPFGLLRFLKLEDNFYQTISATIFVFPIVSYYFSRASLGSFLVNTLVLWVTPHSMFFGFVTILAGLFSTRLSRLVGGITWLLLRFFNVVAEFFSNLPLVWEVRVPFFGVCVYYLVLFGVCWFFQMRSKKEVSR